MQALRTVMLGLDDTGREWLESLRNHPSFELVGVADPDAALAERIGDEARVPGYDDLRLVLVEQQADAALVCLRPSVAEPYFAIAAQTGTATLCEPPAARGFEDLVRIAGDFYDADVPLVIASRWRFDPVIGELLGGRSPVTAHLGHATVLADLGPRPGWRGDAEHGGGVLRCAAYEAIDLLVHCFGLPGDVVAQMARSGPLASSAFDAEDTVALLARCSGGSSFSLSAAWRTGGPLFDITMLAGGARWRIVPEWVEVVPADAAPYRRPRPDAAALRRAALDRFSEATRARGETYPGRVTDQLPTGAVIEAAYHAGRTLSPESPLRAYERAGLPTPRMPSIATVL